MTIEAKIIAWAILFLILISGLFLIPRYFDWKARKRRKKEPPTFDKYLEEIKKKYPDYFDKNPPRTSRELPLEL